MQKRSNACLSRRALLVTGSAILATALGACRRKQESVYRLDYYYIPY